MSLRGAWLASILSVLAVAAVAVEPADFLFQCAVESPQDAAPGVIASFKLDADAYSVLSSNGANMRLFDDTGAQAPFLFRKSKVKKAIAVFRPVDAAMLDLSSTPDGKQEMVLESRNTVRPVFVVIYSEGRPMWKKIKAYGSHDCVLWHELVKDAAVYDLQAFGGPAATDVEINQGDYPYLKFVISEMGGDEKAALAGLALSGKGPDEGQTSDELEASQIKLCVRDETSETVDNLDVEYRVLNYSVSSAGQDGKVAIRFDAERVPLRKVWLAVGAGPFAATARLYRAGGADSDAVDAPSVDDDAAWLEIKVAPVYRLASGASGREDLQIRLDKAVRSAHYKLVLESTGGLPLIDGLRITGEAHEAVFLPQAERNYTLYYGGTVVTELPEPDESIRLAVASEGEAAIGSWRLGKREAATRQIVDDEPVPVQDVPESPDAAPLVVGIEGAVSPYELEDVVPAEAPVETETPAAGETVAETPVEQVEVVESAGGAAAEVAASGNEPATDGGRMNTGRSVALILAAIAMIGTLIWVLDKALDAGAGGGEAPGESVAGDKEQDATARTEEKES